MSVCQAVRVSAFALGVISVVLLNLYAVVLVVLRSRVYGVPLYLSLIHI